MLLSARPLIDLVVAVDTGSSDNTIPIIEHFGKAYNIPTFVFERPFDNFCASRNYALDKLKETIDLLGWERETTFGFNCDCDEIVSILPAFNKGTITDDMLVLRQRIGRETFTRQGIFRLSKDFYWQSPVHEELVWKDPSVKKKYEFNIEIIEEPVGASWKGNLEEKFLRYAAILKDYIAEGHYNFRSVYFLADSYNAAAAYCKSPARAREYYEIAEQYFEEAATIVDDSREVKFMLYKKMAENRIALGRPWHTVKEYYQRAYLYHPFKAETLAGIICHYLDTRQAEIAYYYARYAYMFFNTQFASTGLTLYVDESLYQWKLLFYYYRAAIMSRRKLEGRTLFRKLKQLQRDHPDFFDEQDIVIIHVHSPLGMKVSAVRKSLLELFTPKKKNVLGGANSSNHNQTSFTESPQTIKPTFQNA